MFPISISPSLPPIHAFNHPQFTTRFFPVDFGVCLQEKDRLEVEEKARRELRDLGVSVPPAKSHWDRYLIKLSVFSVSRRVLMKSHCYFAVVASNVITPGTAFMGNLSTYLRFFIYERMNTDKAWQSIKVILFF